jgi:hypothetical protein
MLDEMYIPITVCIESPAPPPTMDEVKAFIRNEPLILELNEEQQMVISKQQEEIVYNENLEIPKVISDLADTVALSKMDAVYLKKYYGNALVLCGTARIENESN